MRMIGRIVAIRLADIVLADRRSRHDDLAITVRTSSDTGLRLTLKRRRIMVRVALAPDGRPLQADDHRQRQQDPDPRLE